MAVRILLVDDHLVFVSSLKMVLESNNFIVNTVLDADMALGLLKSCQYDVVISDIDMPGINGIELIKKIKNLEFDLNPTFKLIILTSYKKISLFKKLYALNVDGFLNKSTSPLELINAIRKVLKNEKYYDSEIYNAFLKSNVNINNIEFTKREFDVLKLIFEEKTTNQIAQDLQISPYTVEGHRKNLLQKTNSKNVVGLIKFSLDKNLF